MSVYLAAKTQTAAADHPLFKSKGVTGYTATQLTRLFVHGMTTSNEVAYGAYRQNISIFISATHHQRRIAVTEPGALLSNYDRPTIPTLVPSISFVLREKPSADTVEAMRGKFEVFYPQFEKIGNSTRVTCSNPTMRFADAMTSISQPTVQGINDAIHPSMLRSYYHIIHVISEFLATNTYSGYRSQVGAEGEEETEAPGSATLEISRIEEMRGIGIPNSAAADTYMRRSKKLMAITCETEVDWEEVTTESLKESLNFNLRAPMYFQATSLAQHVLTAKPSPIPPSSNFGPVSAVPTGTPGLVFPWIPRMFIPERHSLSRYMYSIFARTFGSTHDEIISTLKTMTPGFESLSLAASQGHLVHILEGISLSLQTQTRLFCIFEDKEYLGFVLLGGRFKIFDGTSWIAPSTGIALEAEIAKLSSHAGAMTSICENLTGMTLKASEGDMETTEEVDPKSMTSSGKLLDQMLRRKMSGDEMEEISDLLQKLRFADAKFKDFSGMNLQWFVDQMSASPFVPLDDGVHVHIPPKFTELDDPMTRYLAAFGPDVPSPQNTRGDLYKLPSLSTNDKGEEYITESDHLPTMIFARKPLLVAANDWRSTLKSKSLRMDEKERARSSRCLVLKGDLLKKVEFGMVRWVTSAKTMKRTRDQDDEGEGSSVKRGKKAVTASIDDILGSW